ncbi:SDR family oxidoreductase [Streptomyces sp. NPDC100445]|uniref:SDR family oxidoreductase n=1 Tax=Streptomyces sp. NPDC100445 TaxID=3366102 RepID=UPI003818660F
MRAAIGPLQQRGSGTNLNVAGMITFSGPADKSVMPRRAVYAGTLAYLVAMTQTLAAEVEDSAVTVAAVCPGAVATEFHSAQGMDLSAVPRISAEDLVTDALRGLELGETVIAPSAEDDRLLHDVFTAHLTAFGGQSPALTTRYTKEPTRPTGPAPARRRISTGGGGESRSAGAGTVGRGDDL